MVCWEWNFFFLKFISIPMCQTLMIQLSRSCDKSWQIWDHLQEPTTFMAYRDNRERWNSLWFIDYLMSTVPCESHEGTAGHKWPVCSQLLGAVIVSPPWGGSRGFHGLIWGTVINCFDWAGNYRAFGGLYDLFDGIYDLNIGILNFKILSQIFVKR